MDTAEYCWIWVDCKLFKCRVGSAPVLGSPVTVLPFESNAFAPITGIARKPAKEDPKCDIAVVDNHGGRHCLLLSLFKQKPATVIPVSEEGKWLIGLQEKNHRLQRVVVKRFPFSRRVFVKYLEAPEIKEGRVVCEEELNPQKKVSQVKVSFEGEEKKTSLLYLREEYFSTEAELSGETDILSAIKHLVKLPVDTDKPRSKSIGPITYRVTKQLQEDEFTRIEDASTGLSPDQRIVADHTQVEIEWVTKPKEVQTTNNSTSLPIKKPDAKKKHSIKLSPAKKTEGKPRTTTDDPHTRSYSFTRIVSIKRLNMDGVVFSNTIN